MWKTNKWQFNKVCDCRIWVGTTPKVGHNKIFRAALKKTELNYTKKKKMKKKTTHTHIRSGEQLLLEAVRGLE